MIDDRLTVPEALEIELGDGTAVHIENDPGDRSRRLVVAYRGERTATASVEDTFLTDFMEARGSFVSAVRQRLGGLAEELRRGLA